MDPVALTLAGLVGAILLLFAAGMTRSAAEPHPDHIRTIIWAIFWAAVYMGTVVAAAVVFLAYGG